MMKKVSVILPTYNRAGILKKAIDSVLAQTYPEFELLIVDDGSTDDTADVVRGYADDRIRYVYTELNRGAAAARNYGIAEASPDASYIAFEDSDDLWHRDKLEKQLREMERQPEAGFCYHKIAYDMGGGYRAILPDERLPVEKKRGDIYAQLLYDNLVDCPSMLIRREFLEQIGGFDEMLKALEDYDLALRLAKSASVAFVNEILLDSAYSTTGVSGSAVNYLTASCILVGKYKKDYLATDTFNHRVETILSDAERAGVKEQIVPFLEKVLTNS